MIRHYDELTKLDMQHKGGKGHILAAELLNGEDFAGKGRVFNHCVSNPAVPSAGIAMSVISRCTMSSAALACTSTMAN